MKLLNKVPVRVFLLALVPVESYGMSSRIICPSSSPSRSKKKKMREEITWNWKWNQNKVP